MANPSAITLVGFIAWALALLILMELLRGYLVMFKGVPANEFRPDNGNLSPFMQRLARAHANCVEGLPIFGGLLLLALITGQTTITDPLAYTLLGARLIQSCVHLLSRSTPAVFIRFAAFAVQLAVATVWAVHLFSVFIK
ncbi:MAPEG family protein [Pseudomonas sp. Hg5Tf]|uniref:MAPEG family protein n=1 Tax=Pseudomonas sp. Hg7Tf TaxID=3236988 RepID=A0AB39I9C0_9PSED|nr:MAPEG family protein [Pseudomonas sp. Hg5Tf]MDH2558809.1 MAPEG family protein [Pseudomonas sp. Hg5Tf]